MTLRLSIGVTTRNRPAALQRCLASLVVLSPLSPEMLVFDDGSDPPATAAGANGLAVRLIRDASSPGYIVGRNRLVREAAAPFILLLDDDTRVLIVGERCRRHRRARTRSDDRSGRFPQAKRRPAWPPRCNRRRDNARLVPSFIGFAHLVRRDVFLALGGYREDFVFYGRRREVPACG